MKNLAKLTFLCLIVGGSFIIAFAQTSRECDNFQIPKNLDISNAEKYKGWQKIDLDELSFCAPKELKRVNSAPYDSKFYHFQSEGVELNIAVDERVGRPEVERTYSSFSQKFLAIEGASYAWMWSFEEKYKQFEYVTGILLKSRNFKNCEIRFQLFHKDAKEIELAENIFKSVKFKTKIESKKIIDGGS